MKPDIPWITALQLVSLAVIILLAFVAWNVSLKHQVKSKTKDLEREVAEGKQKEEALRESEDRFRDLVEHSQDLVCTHDLEGRILSANPWAAKVLGIPPDELLRMNFRDLLVTEVRHKFGRYLDEIRTQGNARGLMWVQTRNGERRLWEYKNTLRTEGVAEPIVRGMAQDITERKRAEEALRASQQIIEGIINAIPARVFWKDRNLVYLGCNAVFARDAGFSDPKDVIGKDDYQMGWRDQAELYRGDDRRVIESGCSKLLIEEPQTTPGGNTITLLTSKIPLRNSNGEISGVIGTYIDISDRKQAEKAVLESERLGAIGEMSSGVAHDFNNSLQVIFGNLEMALSVPNIPQDVVEFIISAKKSATDAVARVRQLQRFTRKTDNVEFSALDLNMMLDEAIIQTRPLWKDEAEKKGLHITFQKFFGKLRSVDGEPGEIGSVFYNLVKNAIEAMPDGGTITLETGVIDQKVYVRISDTGMGMDEETKLRIFQPFFSTKGFELGRGLGMSAVLTTIRDHGGNISVKETAPGKGTIIEALFPFGTKKAEGPDKEVVGADKIPARVLWVDDDEDIRKIGKRYLEALGHFADMAGSGKEALELLEKNPYDLLITDDGMPGMSGWQLVETIKGRYPAMKLAVVTGWGTDVPSGKKETYGVGYVFGKPISMKQLKDLVIDALQSKI